MVESVDRLYDGLAIDVGQLVPTTEIVDRKRGMSASLNRTGQGAGISVDENVQGRVVRLEKGHFLMFIMRSAYEDVSVNIFLSALLADAPTNRQPFMILICNKFATARLVKSL